ncbi:MAG TPA: cupin domain-containing protein [Gaiellaceae bacterium]|nr:cupin domain-containing protein [Gaiellaceae bacterium]
MAVEPPDVGVFRGGRELDIVEAGGSAVAIVWPGTGSSFRSMHRLELDAGGRTVELKHESEAVYFVVSGTGRVGEHALRPHHMVYVARRTPYRIEATEPLVMVGGPCPPDPALYGELQAAAPDEEGAGEVRVFDADREGEPLPMIGKQVRLVVWPGVGAEIATMNFAILEPGEENQPHAHAESEDTIAILDGRGSIDDLTNGVTHEFSAGDVVYVRPGITHKVKADKGVQIVSAGGPCPPDYGMLRALQLV